MLNGRGLGGLEDEGWNVDRAGGWSELENVLMGTKDGAGDE